MGDPTPTRRWLFGPWADLLLGCGLGYAVILAGFAAWGAKSPVHPAVPALLSVVVLGPHYGATLLRVYERRSERRSYAIFSVWATLAVLAAVWAGVYERAIAVALYTLYITWSPWHYSGQNYGLAAMFLRRRGVPLDGWTKRLLHLSFVTSFAVTFLSLHSGNGLDYDPNAVPYESTRLAVYSLGIPLDISRTLMVAAIAAYLASLVGAGIGLRRRAAWRELAPAGALVASQALWFAVPFSVGFFGWRTGFAPFDHLEQFVLWTALAHAVQYLWITSYYARNAAGWTGQTRYLFKALAAGAAVWTLPVIAFAPDRTGGAEYLAGLALLVAAGVNIHHFILDGAIWKLRHSRIASVLIRPAPDAPGPGAIEPGLGLGWTRRAVWAVCAASVAIAVASIWGESSAFERRLRAGDLAGAETLLDRLAWVGRDSGVARFRLAAAWAAAGESELATTQLERSLALRSTQTAWASLAGVAYQRGDWSELLAVDARAAAADGASPELDRLVARAYYERGEPERARERIRASAERDPGSASRHVDLAELARQQRDLATAVHHYREALRLDPERRNAANNLAWILATARDPGLRDPQQAVRWARHALDGQQPVDPNLLDTLAIAYAAAGRRADAVATAERAAELAHEQGLESLARELQSRLAEVRAGAPAGTVADAP